MKLLLIFQHYFICLVAFMFYINLQGRNRGVNHSLESALEIPMKNQNQKSPTPKPEMPLKNEKSCTLNVKVIYPVAEIIACLIFYIFTK